MKQAIVCYNCRKTVRLSDTYSVNIVEDVHTPLTGDNKRQEFVTKLCPVCTSDAGYKVSKEKLQRHTDRIREDNK